MRDGRPNPDIWGNIITCGEIAVGIYEIVGTKKRGLEIPKAVAEDSLPESVMEQATQDGEALCFTDPVSNAIVADALLEQELVIDPKAAAQLEAIRQLDDVSYDTGFEPSISDVELDGLDLERSVINCGWSISHPPCAGMWSGISKEQGTTVRMRHPAG